MANNLQSMPINKVASKSGTLKPCVTGGANLYSGERLYFDGCAMIIGMFLLPRLLEIPY